MNDNKSIKIAKLFLRNDLMKEPQIVPLIINQKKTAQGFYFLEKVFGVVAKDE